MCVCVCGGGGGGGGRGDGATIRSIDGIVAAKRDLINCSRFFCSLLIF